MIYNYEKHPDLLIINRFLYYLLFLKKINH